MKRIRWALPVVMLALSAVVEAQDARPADRRGADDQLDMPAAPLRVHEWGVWHVGRNGRMDSLADLARESPAFVHRAPAVPAAQEPTLPPFQDPMQYGTFDKPVLFLYATTELQNVTVRVRVPHGRPWLYYPDATVGRISGDRALSWTGTAMLQNAALPQGVTLQTPPDGHWWTYLRGVNASPFVTAGTRSAEKFLFYDGEAPFPVGFRAHGSAAPTPVAGHTEAVAWVLGPNECAQLDVRGGTATRTDVQPNVPVNGLRAQLVAHGLSAPEAESLLQTWRTQLFSRSERHVIWLLTRADYDAMLPLEVLPTPIETVRVGVVIQAL